MRPTIYAKQQITELMRVRGLNFLGAALLIRRQGAYDFVVLHLMCQGLEIFLKAVLLQVDYDTYRPKLKRSPRSKSGYGHNLELLATDVCTAVGLHPVDGSLLLELRALNDLYSQHLLRYPSAYDILVGPRGVQSALVLRRFKAAVRLSERVRRGKQVATTHRARSRAGATSA